MAIHNEATLETEICTDLASRGWLYSPPQGSSISPDDALYDREHALFAPDLLAWMQATQAQAWEQLQKQYTERATTVLLERLRSTLDQHGTLHVLHCQSASKFEQVSASNFEQFQRGRERRCL